jgi:hypothetical protein
MDGKVRIFYRVNQEEFQSEALIPTYDNSYVKEFILYSDEELEYYFQEQGTEGIITTQPETYIKEHVTAYDGKYGRLNQMIQADQEERLEFMVQYRREEELANKMFPTY